ncbi:MAG: hypothetical protein K9I82_06960 [Chitinophagaceae bacterium]|nr:hypothetical protein [Chitinophagaceae bacterium]
MSEKILLSDLMSLVGKAIKYIFSQYVLILKIAIVTGCIGLGYAYFEKDKFKAEATFIVEEKSGSKSGIGALASSVGFDLGSLTGGNAGLFEGDNILDIMQSRLIVEKVLLSNLDTNNVNSQTLADIYSSAYSLNKKWAKDPQLTNFNFYTTPKSEAEKLKKDSILFEVYQKVVKNNLEVKRQNKKGSIINIQVISRDQIFSKLFTERLLKETGDLYVDIKTSNMNNNIARLQIKADSLHDKLYNKSFQAVALVNANSGIKSNVVNEDLTSKDKSVVFTLYGEVLKNLEGLKLSQINQTPVIQVLDMPKYPLVNQTYHWLIYLLGGILVGVLIGVIFAIYLYTETLQ